MEGWISLHRKILENPIVCKDSDYFFTWCYLLLNATHSKYDTIFEGKRVTLQPGQLITGRKSIAEKLKISESKVQRILKTFESEQQIEQQTTPRNRLISIVNWISYQQSEQQNEQQVNNKRTTSEQQVNTNNNDNNINNDNNGNKKNGISKITECYENNIGLLTPATAELLFSYLDNMDYELICKAIKIASIANKRNGKYINGILRDWNNKGYTKLLDIEEENKTEIKNEPVIEYKECTLTEEEYFKKLRGE